MSEHLANGLTKHRGLYDLCGIEMKDWCFFLGGGGGGGKKKNF